MKSCKLGNTLVIIISLILMITSCSKGALEPENNDIQILQGSSLTATPFQPQKTSLFLGEGLPTEWEQAISAMKSVSVVTDPQSADLLFQMLNREKTQFSNAIFEKVFAVVVPFFTIEDEINLDELITIWTGAERLGTFVTIVVTDDTAHILDALLGIHGSNVKLSAENNLLEQVRADKHALAIIPFETLEPEWKVLKVSGFSPLDKPLDEVNYPLAVQFGLSMQTPGIKFLESSIEKIKQILPHTNRDESRMTVLVMSGTTALTRGTAYKIIARGIDYPIELVKDWFLTADLRHVSNEVSFDPNCPDPDPYTSSMRFCAQPESIAVLEGLGVNVVELTGNHLNDYGVEKFSATLQMYEERGWATFGGGYDPDSAVQPALIEHNGNKIAFIGCSSNGPWAEDGLPGAAKCDLAFLTTSITKLKNEGYVVISTFQDNEIYEYMYAELFRERFKTAANAGADIVQGSQAHYPMGFEFVDNSFIHYGLGNFIFDQMDTPVVGTRREFIDRHIIYDGKYINTELLTALLMDWARPTPMSLEDRQYFLSEIFTASLRRAQ